MGNILRTITLIAVSASLSFAHVGDRVVPISEIPEEFFDLININDAAIDDWLSVIGEPSLTGLDFTANFGAPGQDWGEEYNPADLDFRIWLAWHRELNRIYVAAQGVDDVLVDQSDGYFDEWYWDGMMRLEVDGDHSGGIFVWDEEDDQGLTTWWQGVQLFSASPLNYRRDPAVYMLVPDPPDDCCWFSKLPFADMSSAVIGEKPSVWVTEMYVTPFDRLVLDSMDETVISELGPGKVIGLKIFVTDLDDPQRQHGYDGLYSIPTIDPESNPGPDFFGDGLLVPVGGAAGSAVESVTWGRIKASLQP